MYKLAPLMAYAYAFRFSAISLNNYYLHVLNNEIKKNNDFSNLDILHHLSSGQKSVYTTITKDGLEVIRQSCGGAGFSDFSGLPYVC